MSAMSKATMVAALVAYASASDVIVGTEDNFEAEIAEGVVLAEFYAPWCGHCKRLAPEWEKAATELKGKAKLIKVDATVESSLGSKYGVQGYPTIKGFIDGGDAMDYDGGRTAADFVAWVNKMAGPAVKTVEGAAELSALREENRVLVTGFFASEESEEAKAFAAVAKKERANFVFAAVYDAALAKEEGVTVPGLVVYKHFDNKKDVAEKFDKDEIVAFAKGSSFPLFDEIGPDNYRNYVDRKLPIGWLFVDPADEEKTTAAKAAVEAVAADHKGKISLVWLSGVQYGQMAGRVGLSGKNWPSFGIDDGEHFAFDESKELTKEALAEWMTQWAAGKLEPTVKSEEVPAEATKGGVTTLVGDSFKEIVFDKTKNVFIKFYAPWCGHCKSMIPAYEELGKHFEDKENIVIAKMDSTANDAPKGFDVQGFPTLKFVRAGSNEILDYSGGRDFEGMKEFIEANAEEA